MEKGFPTNEPFCHRPPVALWKAVTWAGALPNLEHTRQVYQHWMAHEWAGTLPNLDHSRQVYKHCMAHGTKV
jgi:hypothetical protein